jgi:uncharacterized protein
MSIKRSIFNRLERELSTKPATILVGPRQVGKTTLLRQLEERFETSGKKTRFFDLEQPDQLALFNRSDGYIIQMLCEAGDVVFMDEFHYLRNAFKIFKAIYDKNSPLKIYASGSSALEIHTHLKESLAGRKFLYHIYPCSLDELKQAIPVQTFEYYCLYGGMPGTIHYTDPSQKKQLLMDILQSYLLKDIKALIREENLRAFNHLLYLLAYAQGSTVSIDSLARDVGMSPHTIHSYLDVLAQTYVNFPLYSYSRNLANELKKSKKFYLYDIGLRNALLKNFAPLDQRQDSGTLVETFVFHELQKHLSPETELRFWRLKNGVEVDFIWIKNQIPTPIEVKHNWRDQRLPGGLKAFLKRYPDTKYAFVISMQKHRDVMHHKTKISFLRFEDVAGIPETIAS